MTILVTGCAGFIGSNFVHVWLSGGNEPIVNIDKLTYAGNAANLGAFDGDRRYRFVQGDIGDHELVDVLLAEHRPRAVINFAAESHVDRSIHGPGDFIHTNVVGTFNLLESVRGYWQGLADDEKAASRSCTFRRTRSTAHLKRQMRRSAKPTAMSRTRLTRQARPRAIIWCVRGSGLTGCRR
jgi:dTDP-glucose 4,6-dehydratase